MRASRIRSSDCADIRPPLPGVVFGGLLDRGQAVVPEASQEPPRLGQPLGPRPVEPLGSLPALLHQLRLTQDPQMLRHGLPRSENVPRSPLPGALDPRPAAGSLGGLAPRSPSAPHRTQALM